MSDKEIVIPHEKISDPQTITPVMQKILAENDFDMKRDSFKIEDSHGGDHPKGVRVIRANKARKFFDMGRGKK